MSYAYSRLRYQVSVYRTIGLLVFELNLIFVVAQLLRSCRVCRFSSRRNMYLPDLLTIQVGVVNSGLTKQRKERSFRERKIFIRREHFITLLSALNSFQCHFIHKAIKI